MKTRRVEQLIREIRRRSNNIEWGSNSGISDDTISQILNGAKDRLQSLILESTNPSAFTEENIITTVSGQERYELPVGMLDPGGVVSVDIKVGNLWQPMDQRTLNEREAGFTGRPYAYIRDGRDILLRPVPQDSSTQIRVTYIKRLNDLNTVLGIVSSTAPGEIIPNAIGSTDIDLYRIDTYRVYDHISITEADGEILNTFFVEWDTDDSDSKFIILDDAITNHTSLVGKKIVMGYNASNYLFDVDTVMSEYLIQYGADYLTLIDSNGDVANTSARLQSLEAQILSSYAKENQDIILVPDINRRGY